MPHEWPTHEWWKRLVGWVIVEGCRETQRRLIELSRHVQKREAQAMVAVLEFVNQQGVQDAG